MSPAPPSTPDRPESPAARPWPRRALLASACLAAAFFAADCAWQRAFVPRLMGLQGAWYRNDGWRGEAALTAVDADLATATLSRRQREIGADAFSVAWTGQLEIAAPGEFTFFTHSGGATELRIDGSPVVRSSPGEDEAGSTLLAAGRHGVVVSYAQRAGEPMLSLAWARNRQPREPLSAEFLLPPQPDERQIAVYRTGRKVLRALLATSVLFAVAAFLVVAGRPVRALLRESGGLAAAVGLAALLATGAAVLDDFGVSRDETMQRQIGIANYLYVSQGATKLLDPDFLDRLYGPAFEAPLAAVEKEMGLADSRPIYLFRHGATFLLFCVAVVFFYRLCLRHFRHAPTALFACGMLVLAPRIFADSFYNSKDLPLLSLFVVSVWTLVRLLDEWTPRRALWHALASAVLIDVRVVGLVVPALTLLFATGDLLFASSPGRPRRQWAAVLGLYLGATASFTVALFPYLWASPVRRLGEVVATMSRFPYPMTTLYLGREVPAGAIPWHYAPVWIGVTTPPAFLALFGVGLVVIARSCFALPRGSFGNPEARNRLLWPVWFFVPLVSVIATKAAIYSGWRHLYFVYPAFVLVAAEGAHAIVRAARARLPGALAGRGAVLAAVACAVVFAEPVSFLVRNHPYGNVYFNRLAGRDMRAVRDRFDVDYWGLSYRRGLEHVLRRDPRASMRVLLKPGLGEASASILPTGERMRLVFVDRRRDAEYFLGNYQWHRGEYPFRQEVFAVRADGADIMTVYDLRFDAR